LSSYLAFWGKAPRHAHGELVGVFHPAAFHMLDVAAVAGALFDARPIVAARGAALLGVSISEARGLLCVLAALHDIGKFAATFQAKRQDLWPTDGLGPFRPGVAGQHHTGDGYRLWVDGWAAEVVAALWPSGESMLHALAPAVFGHHGRPVQPTSGPTIDVYWRGGRDAALAYAHDCLALLHPTPLSLTSGTINGAHASWWVAGFMTTADWVGSNEQHFPYTTPADTDHPPTALAAYWELAQARAVAAVTAEGLVPATPASATPFADIVGFTATPSPAQVWASTVALPDGPVLAILEDVTGAGKTEAAHMLVHRVLAEGRAAGAFWAMPTQATANAMYTRQAKAVRRLYRSDSMPSLVLAHGQADLHEGFRATLMPSASASGGLTSPPLSDADLPSEVACAAFFADSRRKALLAEVGAGTIDQAILGVLPSRFNALRLFGLADKVLVLDEAHAYDPYVAEEVATLLQFHAALGGSAIILSATLTVAQWERLTSTWRAAVAPSTLSATPRWKRTGAATATPTRLPAYPLATLVSGETDGVRQTALDAAERSKRTVPVRFFRSEADVTAHLAAAVARGAAVAWIRNTVGSCLDGAAQLRALGLTPVVFHARFAQGDRQQREQEVVHCFGKPDDAHPEREQLRRGRVVVATQVVEQSLDLDFDVIVSDLAPLDLLVQRAGRLWRHPARNAGRQASGFVFEFGVLAPPAGEGAPLSAAWPSPLLPTVRFVYARTDILWRTAHVLEEVGCITTPGEPGAPTALRTLMARVYDTPDATPEIIQFPADKAKVEHDTQEATARYSTLSVNAGYAAGGALWDDDVHVPTRLGEPQVTVRLARVDTAGTLQPWRGGGGDTGGRVDSAAWALAEVKVPGRFEDLLAHPVAADVDVVRRARTTMGGYEQTIPVVVLRPQASAAAHAEWRGRLDGAVGHLSVSYSVATGLVLHPHRPKPAA
jgi:CRISPR-associated endonuclease/helicase Cas3